MARHPARLDPRPVVHYYPVPDPTATMATPTDLAEYRRHVAELAARRRTDRLLYTRWRRRQAAIAARDRRTRKILLAGAATLAVGVLAALGTTGWLLWHAMTGVDPLTVIALVLFGLVAVGGVGHRCVTVVQHWH